MHVLPGKIDETERFFLPKEKRIAELLAREGKQVKSKKESTKKRTGDAEVDGIVTEFKTLDPPYANNASIKNTINDSIRQQGRARHIIIDARGSGLTEGEAYRGLARARNITRGKLDIVRIIGDDFELFSSDFR
ncbi:MAG: hypothetical protein U0350_51430 [Caldilineaceae bacterium]